MKTASMHELKRELQSIEEPALREICLRLAKHKVENKELLTYLLFEAHDEQSFISGVKATLDEQFATLQRVNLYFVKKTLRKFLRFTNRQIKYSGQKQTEVELRIFFCLKIREAHIPVTEGTVLGNLYTQQLTKINAALAKLPEDLQFDYHKEVGALRSFM